MGTAQSRDGFHWVDYVVFTLVLVISLFIGSFVALFKKKDEEKKEQTLEDYHMGNRNLSVVPVSLTLCLSFMSAILVLGAPAEIYTQGTQYWMYSFGIAGACILAGIIFVPLLYPLNLVSSFDYLELRYKHRAARLMGSFLLISSQLIYMGIAIYSPATALDAVTGFPVWGSILSVGVIATIYTTMGGVQAVVWTSVFQALVMVGGVFAVVVAGAVQVGGMSTVWEYNQQWDRIEFFDFNPDPTVRQSFWSLVVGGAIAWLATYGVNQAAVQRYCALPTQRKAAQTLYLNVPWVIIMVTLTCLSGVVVFAYFASLDCDPILNGDVDSANQILPYFIMQVLAWPGFPGLFVSALFAGALSSMSGAMNAMAAVTWEDWMKPTFDDKWSNKKKTMVTKIIVAIYGVLGIAMAFAAQEMGGTVLQASLAFTGSAMGPMLGLFLMGGIFPWANWIGAIAGGIVGLCFPMWISIGAFVSGLQDIVLPSPYANCSNYEWTTPVPPDPPTGVEQLYSISYLWLSSIGVGTTIVVGLVVSFLTGPMKPSEIDSKYMIPIFDRLLCCLPNKWLAKCRWGYDAESDEDEMINANGSTVNGKESLEKANSSYSMKGAELATENGVYSTSYVSFVPPATTKSEPVKSIWNDNELVSHL